MFECKQCNKTFTRKDSLLRHMKSLHARSDIREFSSNNDANISNQFENSNSHYFFDPLNKQESNNVENKTISVQDDLLESNYEGDDSGRNDSGRNDSDEDISQSFKNNNENNIAEPEERLYPFEQRIQTATQAVQSKFDNLRSQRDIHKAASVTSNESTKNDQREILSVSDNHSESTFIPKLTAILQTALDFLLIKELQSTDAEDECEEENRRTATKRPITLNSTEENDNGQLLTKHIKYNDLLEFENNNLNNKQSKDVVRKYWHNPNTLVNELRLLITTTEIGQQIFKVIQSLQKNNNTHYFYNNVEHEKQQKELTEELNGLKQTNVGQEIFSIIHELQKAEIIEPPTDWYLDELSEADASDNEEKDHNTADDKNRM